MAWLEAGPLQAFAPGRMHRLILGGRALVLYREGESLFCFHDRCSHADVPLSRGWVEDGAIVCRAHGARFDLRTGAALSWPATAPIIQCKIKVDSGLVYVDPNAGD